MRYVFSIYGVYPIMKKLSVRLFQWMALLSSFLLISCTFMKSDIPTSFSEGPVLQLQIDGQVNTLTRTSLLQSPALQTIVIADDVSYHRQQKYQAIPLQSLLPRLPNEGTLQFTALDGFVATIPDQLIQAQGDAAQAWLAIEDPAQPWPALKLGQPSAGPFYLVWVAPEKSHVSGEQWPYQIAKISTSMPLEVRYPQLLPHSDGINYASAVRGLQIFTKNCATCHRLNQGGDASIGPDLNIPMNPTAYFQEAALRKLIRDPGSVRTWQQSSMPGFKEEIISEIELDDLLVYLKQMATQHPQKTVIAPSVRAD